MQIKPFPVHCACCNNAYQASFLLLLLLLLLLLQIQGIREQQPELFQQMLRAAIQQAMRTPNGDAPPCWTWSACEACGKWRLLSDQAVYEMGLLGGSVQFFCNANVDRPGGQGCDEPAEWVEPGAAV
jgi:hypothetical protein